MGEERRGRNGREKMSEVGKGGGSQGKDTMSWNGRESDGRLAKVG
jgi:hypothetical protein